MVDERLWHGGAPGRKPGDLLLPPSESGLTYTRRDMSIEGGLDQIGQRLDRVYFTTDKGLARAYAATWTLDGQEHGGGALYVVEAEEVEPDDDLLSIGTSYFQAPRARVVKVYDPHVPYHPRVLKDFQRVINALGAAKRS